MASVAIQTQLTPEEYLTWERKTVLSCIKARAPQPALPKMNT